MRIGADPALENTLGQSPLSLASLLVSRGEAMPQFLDALDVREYPDRPDARGAEAAVAKAQALAGEEAAVMAAYLRQRYRGTNAAKAVYNGGAHARAVYSGGSGPAKPLPRLGR